jgi:hypothetical protein
MLSGGQSSGTDAASSRANAARYSISARANVASAGVLNRVGVAVAGPGIEPGRVRYPLNQARK